ncbi:hypothetical protein D3C73_1500830 [compost metagenome]
MQHHCNSDAFEYSYAITKVHTLFDSELSAVVIIYHQATSPQEYIPVNGFSQYRATDKHTN